MPRGRSEHLLELIEYVHRLNGCERLDGDGLERAAKFARAHVEHRDLRVVLRSGSRRGLRRLRLKLLEDLPRAGDDAVRQARELSVRQPTNQPEQGYSCLPLLPLRCTL